MFFNIFINCPPMLYSVISLFNICNLGTKSNAFFKSKKQIKSFCFFTLIYLWMICFRTKRWSEVCAPCFPLAWQFEMKLEHFCSNQILNIELNNLPKQLLKARPLKLLTSVLTPLLCKGPKMSFFHSTGYRLNLKIVLNNNNKGAERCSVPFFNISFDIWSKEVALLFLSLLIASTRSFFFL